MAQRYIQQGVVKVVWNDGNYKWYRVARRRFDFLVESFIKVPNFQYGKVYAFHPKTKQTGRQLGYFGINQKTGLSYREWIG